MYKYRGTFKHLLVAILGQLRMGQLIIGEAEALHKPPLVPLLCVKRVSVLKELIMSKGLIVLKQAVLCD